MVRDAMQEEDRLRTLCDEKCAKVVSEGRCASLSSGDARMSSELSCNGSPTLQRQSSSRTTVAGPPASRSYTSLDVDESVYKPPVYKPLRCCCSPSPMLFLRYGPSLLATRPMKILVRSRGDPGVSDKKNKLNLWYTVVKSGAF